MKMTTTITIEDKGCPPVDITVCSDGKNITVEFAGCKTSLSSKEAFQVGRLFDDASFRTDETAQPTTADAFGLAAASEVR